MAIGLRGFAWVAGLAIGLCVSSIHAATVAPADLTLLQTQAAKDGAAPVVVWVNQVPITALGNEAVRLDSERKALRLYEELGAERWAVGRTEEFRIGMVTAYVTSKGLEILQGSDNAVSFQPGRQWAWDTHLERYDGSVESIEQQLDLDGHVQVVVTVNVEGLTYEVRPDGRIDFMPGDTFNQDFVAKGKLVLQSLLPAEVLDTTAAQQSIARAQAGLQVFDPRLTVRLTRQGVIRLALNRDVRALAPLGFLPTRPRYFDLGLLATARRNGVAEAVILVRDPLSCSCLSPSSDARSREARVRNVTGVLARADLLGAVRIEPWGWGSGYLTAAQLERLLAVADDRLVMVRAPSPPSTAGDVIPTTPDEPVAQPVMALTTGIATAVDTVLDWAETRPPLVVSPPGAHSQSGAGYRFRYYAGTESYLGVNEVGIPHLHYLGPLSGNRAVDLGFLLDWLPLAAP